MSAGYVFVPALVTVRLRAPLQSLTTSVFCSADLFTEGGRFLFFHLLTFRMNWNQRCLALLYPLEMGA